MKRPTNQDLEVFLRKLSTLKPSFPVSYRIDKDGSVIFVSAGTQHMWAGWLLAKATFDVLPIELKRKNLIAVGQAELAMVRNALRRDAENGFVIRGEMLVELEKSCVGLELPTQKEKEEVVEFICYDAQHNVWLKRGDTGSVTRKIQDAQHWPTKIAASDELRRRALPDDEWVIQSVRYVVKPEEGTELSIDPTASHVGVPPSKELKICT